MDMDKGVVSVGVGSGGISGTEGDGDEKNNTLLCHASTAMGEPEWGCGGEGLEKTEENKARASWDTAF